MMDIYSMAVLGSGIVAGYNLLFGKNKDNKDMLFMLIFLFFVILKLIKG